MLFGSTILGVWLPTVVSALSVPAKTANNWADVRDKIGANCQSLPRRRSVGLENFGVVATILIPNNWRRSIPRQLPRNCRRLPGTETPPAVGLSAYTSLMQCDQV